VGFVVREVDIVGSCNAIDEIVAGKEFTRMRRDCEECSKKAELWRRNSMAVRRYEDLCMGRRV